MLLECSYLFIWEGRIYEVVFNLAYASMLLIKRGQRPPTNEGYHLMFGQR